MSARVLSRASRESTGEARVWGVGVLEIKNEEAQATMYNVAFGMPKAPGILLKCGGLGFKCLGLIGLNNTRDPAKPAQPPEPRNIKPTPTAADTFLHHIITSIL